MSASRPTPITDPSKFQEKTINGVQVRYAQHSEDAKMYTVDTEDATVVMTLKEGVTLDDGLAECVKEIEQQKAVHEQQIAALDMIILRLLLQNPALASAMFGLGGPSTSGPSSPGTSRFGAFGGSRAPMDFDRDNSEEFRPSSPRI